MVLGLPSLSDFLSRQSEKAQAQFEVFYMLGPFFVGWMVFLYYWVFCLWDWMDSLPLPSVIMAIGYMFYFRWKNKILEDASSLYAVSMRVRWWEGYERVIKNVISGWMDLSEQEAYEGEKPLADIPRRCPQCEAPIPPLEEPPSQCPTCTTELPKLSIDPKLLGEQERYFAKVRFSNRNIDYDGRLWKWAVYIMDFPFDLTFKKIPGQWFTHKGLMFRTATASIDVTYIGFKEEIHHVKYFRVTSSPERTRRIQMGLGLTPATATTSALNKARDLSSLRVGIEEFTKRQEAEAHADLAWDSAIDSKTRGYEGAERALDDLDGIRERGSSYKGLKDNWKKYLMYGLIIVAVVWFAWSSGWLDGLLGGGSPPPGNYTQGG